VRIINTLAPAGRHNDPGAEIDQSAGVQTFPPAKPNHGIKSDNQGGGQQNTVSW